MWKKRILMASSHYCDEAEFSIMHESAPASFKDLVENGINTKTKDGYVWKVW